MPLVPPVVLLAVLFILIVTHTFYLWRPARMPYWQRLVVSTLGLAGGEILAVLGVLPQLHLGDLHVVTDLAVAAALQLAGQRWVRSGARPARLSR